MPHAPSRRLATCLAAALAATSLADDEGLRPGETVRETDDVFPGAVPEAEDGLPTVWPVRIVDASTGRPIPRATVRVPNHNADGSAPEDIYDLCSGIAGRDGWVRLPWKDAMGWRDYIVADAPGYAPSEHCDLGNASCALTPGIDVPVRLFDFTGRPVAGAAIALNLGCGHIADQRAATTDDDGRAVFRSIDPVKANGNSSCIWIESPRLHRGTAIFSRDWRLGDEPVPIYGSPGVVVSGRVLGLDGKPVKNAVVGAHEQHRPWIRTGEDGRFRLVGVEPWSKLDLYPQHGTDEGMTWFFAPPEGVDRIVTLGAVNSGVPLVVTLRGPAGEPAEGARIVLVRISDGLTAPRLSDAEGRGEFSLPPGRYQVIVEGALGAWGGSRGTVELTEGAAASVALTVPRSPVVRVDASRVQKQKVKLCTSRECKDLDPAEIDGKDVPVPADERAVFFVFGHEDRELHAHIVEAPKDATPGEPFVLDWVPRTRVTAELVGPDGEPRRGRLRVERRRGTQGAFTKDGKELPASETPSAETHLAGTLDWVAEPEDSAFSPASGTFRIAEAGKSVSLGKVRLPRASGRTFRVEIPKGTPTEGVMATVKLRRTSYFWTGIIEKDGSLGVDLPWLGPGEVVTVSVPGNLAPREFRVEGSPPWVVRWPETSLTVHVFDAAGAEISGASVLVDDPVVAYETDDNGALLVGLPQGTHEIVVAADGHRAKILGLVLKDGDTRELRVRLSPRN